MFSACECGKLQGFLLLLFNVESEPVYKLYVKQVFPNFRNFPFHVELFQSHSFSYCIISFHFGLKPNRKWPEDLNRQLTQKKKKKKNHEK